MASILLGFVSGGALLLTVSTGPVPTDRSTNKPSPAQCAAAQAQGRSLPGCDEPEAQPAPAEVNEAQPRERFIVCPGDRRCPR